MRKAVILAMALAACGPADMKSSPTVRGEAAMDVTAAPEQAMGGGPGGGEAPAAPNASPAAAPMLAYVYGATLELPFRNVRATMAKHEAQCRAAGPAVCQVLGSSVSTDGEESVFGNVQLRAEPRWLEGFRNGLEAEARDAGGRVRETSVSSEDLTRQIVDTDARLRAQKVLRDRLQQLLRTRPGKLTDLLETERELARVQGEIDSAESQLAVMRQRVATSLMNLAYQSRPTAVTSGTFEPVADAFTEFASIVMMGFAFIIRLVAVLIPLGLVIAPLAWLFLRWRRRRAAAKPTPASSP